MNCLYIASSAATAGHTVLRGCVGRHLANWNACFRVRQLRVAVPVYTNWNSQLAQANNTCISVRWTTILLDNDFSLEKCSKCEIQNFTLWKSYIRKKISGSCSELEKNIIVLKYLIEVSRSGDSLSADGHVPMDACEKQVAGANTMWQRSTDLWTHAADGSHSEWPVPAEYRQRRQMR